MDDTIHWPHGHHYPAPMSRNLINDPTPRDQGIHPVNDAGLTFSDVVVL
jgi:hypothetical protein